MRKQTRKSTDLSLAPEHVLSIPGSGLGSDGRTILVAITVHQLDYKCRLQNVLVIVLYCSSRKLANPHQQKSEVGATLSVKPDISFL